MAVFPDFGYDNRTLEKQFFFWKEGTYEKTHFAANCNLLPLEFSESQLANHKVFDFMFFKIYQI